MLFLGCERDDVPIPKPDTLAQQTQLDLFFKSHRSKEDNFRDIIVQKMLALNDSTGIVFDLFNRYGQPRWSVEKTNESKSGKALFVPVKALSNDSICAVFVFVDSANTTKLRILDNSSPDTLVTDFILHYQYFLYGKSLTPSRLVKRVPNTSKDWEEWQYCLNTCTSVDGVNCIEITHSSCYNFWVWVSRGFTEEIDLPDISDGGSGGGDSGGEESPTFINLNDDAKNNLKNAENKLKNGPCLSQTVMGSTWNSGLTIAVNSSLGSMGSHSPGIIEFRSATSISDITLLHELFHEYQNKVNGILPVTQLSEFEAWLFVDLYLWDINNEDLSWTREWDDDWLLGDYKDWIDDIYENGFNDSNMADYTKWFNEFMKVKDSAYGDYPVGNNSNPGAIINVLNVCNY